MSREILFRGKTTKKDSNKDFNNIWIEGDLITSKDKYYIHPKANIFKVESELAKLMVCHEVIPETINQSTGLTDKNGKKIFEGDICKHRSEYSGKFIISVVTYTDGCFLAMADNNSGFNLSNNLEIIGNKYNNPELLQEKQH